MPDGSKLHGKNGKYVLKEAAADLIPSEILHRKKMGFPTPLRAWLQDAASAPLLKTLLEDDGFLASVLDLGQVQALLERQASGAVDATDRIWRLLNLQIWGDLFLTGRRERAGGAKLPRSRSPHEDPFGSRRQLPASHHQGRADPHAGDAAAPARAQRSGRTSRFRAIRPARESSAAGSIAREPTRCRIPRLRGCRRSSPGNSCVGWWIRCPCRNGAMSRRRCAKRSGH